MNTSAGVRMRRPAHPGRFVKHEIIDPLGLTLTRAAEVLGVTRATLCILLNKSARLSSDMAVRIEKAFGVSMDTLMRMGSSYDITQARERAGQINVAPSTPPPSLRARVRFDEHRRARGRVVDVAGLPNAAPRLFRLALPRSRSGRATIQMGKEEEGWYMPRRPLTPPPDLEPPCHSRYRRPYSRHGDDREEGDNHSAFSPCGRASRRLSRHQNCADRGQALASRPGHPGRTADQVRVRQWRTRARLSRQPPRLSSSTAHLTAASSRSCALSSSRSSLRATTRAVRWTPLTVRRSG